LPSAPTNPTARIDELSLVLPAYNEEASIEEVLVEARGELAKRCARFEIVVVDDGSTDRTADRLTAVAERIPELRVVPHEANRGYSAALRTGFGAARFDPVLYTDADGQFDLADLDRAIGPLRDGADLVAGYRADRADPWIRKLASWVFNRIARAVVGVRARDVDCAFKLFRLEFLRKLDLKSEGFLIDTEIYLRARRLGAKIVQLPVRHRRRRGGASTVRWSSVTSSLRELARLRRTLRSEAADASPRRGAPPTLAVAAVIGLTTLLALAGQGNRGLAEPDEGRYVDAAIRMVESGDWTVPRLQELAYLDKPPLVYWSVAASIEAFGRNELAARMPLAAAHVLTSGAVLWLGYLLWGLSGALASGLAYAISLGPFLASNVLTPDALLAPFVAWMIALVWSADRGGRTAHWALAGVAAGLGLMTKGAALLVFVGAAAVALTIVHRGLGWLRRLGPWLAIATAVGIAAPWHLRVWSSVPGAFDYMLSNQVVGRLTHTQYDRNPEWTKILTVYPPVILAGFLPWTLLLLGRVRQLASRVRTLSFSDPTVVLLASWLVVPFAVFSIARSRLPLYVLPLFTPLALVAGAVVRQAVPEWSRGRRRALGALAVAWVATLLGLKLFVDLDAWHPDRDGRSLARLLDEVEPDASVPVVAVDVTLHSATFYGRPSPDWATVKPLPYPMFETPPQLEAWLIEGAADEFLMVARARRETFLADLAESSGFDCRRASALDRLVVLRCVSRPRADPAHARAAAPGGSAVPGMMSVASPALLDAGVAP